MHIFITNISFSSFRFNEKEKNQAGNAKKITKDVDINAYIIFSMNIWRASIKMFIEDIDVQ